MATKVSVSVWPDDYPNTPVDGWVAEFSSESRAIEYVDMLGHAFKGTNVTPEGPDGIEVVAFA